MPMHVSHSYICTYICMYMQSTPYFKFISLSLSLFLPADMSTLNHLLDLHLQEQLCYVQCGFCTTVLLVSVPYSCLSMVVTVKCGHCTSLLSVSMIRRSPFLPLHLFSSLDNQQAEPRVEAYEEDEEVPKLPLSKHSSSSSPIISSDEDNDDDDDDDLELENHVTNKPPEKRQRAPSAYNKFIKEEIRRLKEQHPNMSHKQAFSTAAKNWAHSPPSQQNAEEEERSKGSGNEPATMLIQELGSDQDPS